MEYKFLQYPRGTNKGGVLNVEVCPTISCSSWENNCMLMEIKEPKIIEEGNYKPSGHSCGKVHNVNGISSTVMENHGAVIAIKEPITICLNSKVNGKQPSLEHRIYDSGGISTAITTGFLPSIAEPMIGAMRGRNPEKPSERGISNGQYKQRLEMNENGTSNTITGVQKDNLVIEPNEKPPYNDVVVEVIGVSVHPNSHKLEFGGEKSIKTESAPALRATDYKCPPCAWEKGNFRIRKLTPRECFRLMDVDDADIDKIQASGISNSQQYKLAGNSIVVNCLYHLFRKMFVETENENEQLTLF